MVYRKDTMEMMQNLGKHRMEMLTDILVRVGTQEKNNHICT